MARYPTLLLALACVVTLAAGCGGGSAVQATAGPTIASVEPASGGTAGGTPLLILGSGLANPQAGEYQVLIGGQPAVEVTVVSDSEVECKTPPGTQGAADVEVVTLEGDTMAPSAFTYYPPPTITAITPNEGTRDGGTPVTVTGTGFTANDPGETLCLIELKVLDDLVVVDDTTITGRAPSSWIEVAKDVTVVNRNGSDELSRAYTYFGPIPQIYSITPTLGPRSGGTACTITGEFFTVAGGDLSVRFGDAEAALVNRLDDQTLTCVSPLASVPGFTDVTVGNVNGESTLPGAFFYIPAPILTSVTPNTGSIIGGDAVTITGLGFTAVGAGTTLVTFGGTPVSNMVIVDDSTITCNVPGGSSIGAVNVVIVNGNGLDTLPAAYTYTAPCWWETPLGTQTTHSDDSSRSFSIGISFPFYGSTYSTLWINSNGSITSTSQTSLTSTSLLNSNQIAIHQDDLNPAGSGGRMYTKSLSDRWIVTLDSVAPFSGGGTVEAQAHLIDNGTICIMYRGDTISGPYYIGLNPARTGSAATTANLDSASGNSGSSSSTIIESFGSFDLTGGFIMFIPDGSGGYDQSFVPTIP